MTNNQSERDVRIAKIQKIKDFGIVPFAQRYDKTDNIQDIISTYDGKDFRDIEDIIKDPQNQVSTAGRVMLHRSHGKILFMRLLDSTEQIQIMFHKDHCKINKAGDLADTLTNSDGEEISTYKFAEKFVDMGDFLGVKGEVFRTHKGELSIFASEFTFLSKAIRPLPEKFHGIQNQEAMYRQRYLDLTANESTFERFRQRSKFLKTIRDFYDKNNFLEVETSILGNAASGAAAQPFITHHNDYDLDMYLRISPETALKKLTAGKFERVFEVAKDFRNEGSDPSHIQEFTMIEHYAAYWSFEDNMKFTEEMFEYIFDNMPYLQKVVKVKDKQGVEKEVDRSTPRQRVDYIAQVQKDSGIDVSQYTAEDEEKLRADIKAKGHTREGLDIQTTATMIDYLYKKVTRPKIVGPAFIYNYPKTMQPLARVSDADNNIVEQRQLLVNGRELIKAYSELVDPILQQANFDEQADALAKGDEEATSGDEEFVIAMEHGMPCQSGRGMGIDRIFALLTEQENIRDVVLFPLMKPLDAPKTENTKEVKSLKEAFENKAPTTDNMEMYEEIPSVEDAHKLVDKYLTETKNHCYQVAKVMKHFAHKLGQNEELWYLVGLLHDIDRDHIDKDAAQHLQGEFEQIMGEINASEILIEDIRSHYEEGTGVPVNTLMRKYLASVDELTAFVYTVSLMRPTGLDDMQAKSVTKKIKDKGFAAAVSREHLKNCEKYLDIPVAEFIPEIIEALKA